MAKHDNKADTTLPQTQISITDQSALIERLSQLEDRLHNLLACYQFFSEAIRLMPAPEHDLLDNNEQWHLGLFLNQQWLTQQGEQLLPELVKIKQALQR